MSIILRALKKVQNQREKSPPAASAEETAEPKAAGTDANASPPAVEEDTERFDDISALAADVQEEQPDPVLGSAGKVRHGFGPGPKALLGLLLILAIFTTGWFASKIYLSLNSRGAATETDSSARAKQPVEPIRAARATLPPAEHAPPVEPPPAQQPEPPIEEPPAPAQASAPRDVTPSQPVHTVAPAAEAPPQPVASAVVEEPLPAAIPEVEPAMSVPPPLPVAKQDMRQTKPAEPESAPPVEKESIPVKKGRPDLKINAIAWKAKEPKAIVNMQRVRVGDVIEGAKVLAIKKKIIFFEYDGEFFEVRF